MLREIVLDHLGEFGCRFGLLRRRRVGILRTRLNLNLRRLLERLRLGRRHLGCGFGLPKYLLGQPDNSLFVSGHDKMFP
jgi:hypothetical protein